MTGTLFFSSELMKGAWYLSAVLIPLIGLLLLYLFISSFDEPILVYKPVLVKQKIKKR